MNNLINIINNQCETRNINKHITVSPPIIDNSNKKKNTSRAKEYKYIMKHLDTI